MLWARYTTDKLATEYILIGKCAGYMRLGQVYPLTPLFHPSPLPPSPGGRGVGGGVQVCWYRDLQYLLYLPPGLQALLPGPAKILRLVQPKK